jgi:predicted transglutaminase-like cysteine proteinase
MTVVRDEEAKGRRAHRTVGATFLDNKIDEVKVWYRTPYEYVMRQSYLNTRIWMSLDPREANSSLPLAGVRSTTR